MEWLASFSIIVEVGGSDSSAEPDHGSRHEPRSDSSGALDRGTGVRNGDAKPGMGILGWSA